MIKKDFASTYKKESKLIKNIYQAGWLLTVVTLVYTYLYQLGGMQ